MTEERHALGRKAEELTCQYLKAKHFRILGRNWRRPWGELDIIAEQNGVVHFVEVKASRSRVAGFEPFRRADGWKMHKVKRTAQTWLSDHRFGPDTEWQIDLVSIIMGEGDPDIELFQNI